MKPPYPILSRRFALVWSVLALAACLPLAGLAQTAPPAPVTVDEARLDVFSASLWVPGTVISRNDARIGAETDGRITWVAEVGETIEAGSPVAWVDDTDPKLQLEDNEARLQSLLAQERYETANLDRFNRLASSNNASSPNTAPRLSSLSTCTLPCSSLRATAKRPSFTT